MVRGALLSSILEFYLFFLMQNLCLNMFSVRLRVEENYYMCKLCMNHVKEFLHPQKLQCLKVNILGKNTEKVNNLVVLEFKTLN